MKSANGTALGPWIGRNEHGDSQTQLLGRLRLVITKTLFAFLAMGIAQQTTRGVDRPLLLMAAMRVLDEDGGGDGGGSGGGGGGNLGCVRAERGAVGQSPSRRRRGRGQMLATWGRGTSRARRWETWLGGNREVSSAGGGVWKVRAHCGGGERGGRRGLGGTRPGWRLGITDGQAGVAYEGEGRGVWPTNIEVAQRPSVKRGRSALPAQWPCARSPASDPPLSRPSPSHQSPLPQVLAVRASSRQCAAADARHSQEHISLVAFSYLRFTTAKIHRASRSRY